MCLARRPQRCSEFEGRPSAVTLTSAKHRSQRSLYPRRLSEMGGIAIWAREGSRLFKVIT